jgi:hypothetical protein
MHPSISTFPNTSFYEGRISDAPSVMEKEHQRLYLPGSMFGPYSFVNIGDGREERDELGHSKRNFVEVAVIEEILYRLRRGTCSLFTSYLVMHMTFQIMFFFKRKYLLAYFACTEEHGMVFICFYDLHATSYRRFKIYPRL